MTILAELVDMQALFLRRQCTVGSENHLNCLSLPLIKKLDHFHNALRAGVALELQSGDRRACIIITLELFQNVNTGELTFYIIHETRNDLKK